MESFGHLRFSDTSKTVTKKRSNSTRRPRYDSQQFPDYRDNSSLSSTPPSDSVSKASSDDNTGHGTNPRKKELYLNQGSSWASSTNLTEAEPVLKTNTEDGGFGEFSEARIQSNSEQKNSGIDSKRSSEGSRNTQMNRRASGNYSSRQSGVVSDAPHNENKLKKVKLRVGSVTRTINPISTYDSASMGGSSSTKSSRSSDAPRHRQKLILQDSSDEDNSSSPEKGSGLHGVPWKGISKSGLSVKKEDFESVSVKQSDKYEPVRKSKRIPKRRLLDGEFNDGYDDDEEIRYLEKLKTSKLSTDYAEDEDEVGIKRHQKISRVLKRTVEDTGDYGSSRSNKEGKKSRSGRVYDDTDYVGEEEPVSDGEDETKRKKQRKEFIDVSGDSKREMAVTTRQRALQIGRDISSSSGANIIEFPNGLPPVPPRKQKEKLSEVEQQLKKAEAAQRRRMQVEKAARESEAEAIRKILGQDSSRKKREDKIKKRQEELAEERAANAITLTSCTVRLVMGPAGTVVTFPNEMGFPSIFEGKPCSYPPPREKCAAPSCPNPYKYRDSKSKLPLCSLLCYKAINEKMHHVTAC